jgi:hypothetical protein
MNEPINLEQLERQAFLSFHQDGLLDLCLGGALLQLGSIIFLFPSFFAGLQGSTIVWLFIYATLKKGVTNPRLGYVEFSGARQERNFLVMMLLVGILLAPIVGMVIGLLMIPNFMPVLETNYMLILAICGAAALCVVAYYTKIRRFYTYGILIGFLYSLSHFWLLPLYLALLVTGGISFLIGLVIVIQFQHRYPKAQSTENDFK